MTIHEPLLNQRILQFIREHAIQEQSQLQELLQQEGINVPQATLSRRLKKLKVVKVEGIYRALNTPSNTTSPVLSMQPTTANLIVIHTLPGHASGVASEIDTYLLKTPESPLNPILGSLAGDDTILVVLEDSKHLESALKALKSLLVFD